MNSQPPPPAPTTTPAAAPPSYSVIEELLGKTLFTKDPPCVTTTTTTTTTTNTTKFHRIPTCQLLQEHDVDIILFYFSASWCPPCRSFSPILKKLYNNIQYYYYNDDSSTTTTTTTTSNNNNNNTKKMTNHNNKNKKKKLFEVVYISSDRSIEEFEEYYTTMPWCSMVMDPGGESTQLKQKLANMFHIRSIPTVIVIDAKTGQYITNKGRNQIMSIQSHIDQNDSTMCIDFIHNTWLQGERSISIYDGIQRDNKMTVWKFIHMIVMNLMQNPIYLIGTVYIVKRIYNYFLVVLNNNNNNHNGDEGLITTTMDGGAMDSTTTNTQQQQMNDIMDEDDEF